MEKKSKSKTKYISAGIHSQDKSIYKSIRRDRSTADAVMNKLKAWRAGKNPWIVVGNTKVKTNDYWGHYKQRYFIKENVLDATT